MTDVNVKRLAQIEPYSGPHAIPGIRFRPAGNALGITAWGMNVLELDPHCERYPEHDHVKDGQEEVYLLLDGRVTLHAGAESIELERGSFVRVGPGQTRKFVTTDASATILAIGATPGQAFKSML
jgi:mannose-6-phosphate isomerase-like protein (cupin superfamily)